MKTLESDRQVIKIPTRIKKIILGQICFFIENENEFLKNSDSDFKMSYLPEYVLDRSEIRNTY